MKKFEERDIYSQFLNLYPIIREYEFKHCDKPDFIVKKDNSLIGIELAEIFQDSDRGDNSKIKREESFQNRFEILLMEKLKLKTDRSFALTVYLNQHIHFKASKLNDIVNNCLSPCLDFILKNEKGHIDIINRVTHSDSLSLPEEVNEISISLLPKDKPSWNLLSRSCTMPIMEYKHILPTLKKHEEAMKGYKKCNEFWLLIREGNYAAGSFAPEVNFPSYINSTFDKVFVMRTILNQLIQLK